MKILLTDADGLTAYLRFPTEHHQRIRHSNSIERTFHEDRASRGWRGLTMTPVGLRLLQDLRRSLLDPPPGLRPARATPRVPADQPDTVTATRMA